MALGKPNRQFEGKSYSLQFKLKDGDKFVDVGYFQISEPTGEKDANGKNKYHDIGRETDVSGDLVNIMTDSRDTENGPVRSFTLALNDPDKKETYFTRFGLGSTIGRRTANAILNLQAFENVQLGSYSQQNKETKKVYPALSVRQGKNNATIKPKYDPKAPNSQLPPAREYEGKGGKKEYDYTAQEVFLFEKLKEFAKVVQEAAKTRRANSPASQQSAPTQQHDEAGHVDDSVSSTAATDAEADVNPPF